MEGWKCEVLSDVIHLINGGTPSTTNENYWNGEIPWLSVDDFNTGKRFVYDAAKKISKLGLENSATKLLDVGDIIISARGTVGVIAQLASKMAFNQSCYGIKQKLDDLSIDYIYYYLCYYFWAIGVVKTGSTFDTITKKTFDEISISFPATRTEQHKITTILSTIDSSISQTEQLITKYKNIKQGLMHDLLTYGIDQNGTIRNPHIHSFVEKNGMMVPDEWEVNKFSSLFNFYPTACYSRAEMGIDGDFFCVHYGDIHTKYDSFLDAEKEFLPTISEKQSNRYIKLKDGDLIMADASEDYEGVGKSVEVLNIKERQIIAGLHTLLIRSKNDKFINGYRGYIFHSITVKHALDDIVAGWKVYSVSKGRLAEIYIPIPTKREQEIINKTLNTQNNLIVSEQTNLAKLQKLKQGLMQDLLTGKVRIKL